MGVKRGGRGADLYAARQTATVTPTAEEVEELGDDTVIVDEHGNEHDDEPTDDIVVHADEELDKYETDDEDEDGDDDEPDLTTMQKQLAALQAERDELATENTTLRKQADDADMDTAVSNQAVLTQALNSAKRAQAEAEQAIELASEAGDHKAVAAATLKLTKAVQAVDRFELASEEMAAEIEDRKAKPRQPKAAPTGGDDPYAASLKAFSQPSRDWLIKHREHIEGNQKVGLKAQGLAQLALSEGIEVDTPEFFSYLEKGMGFKTVAKEPTPPKRTKTPPARPQTGAPSGQRGGSGTRQEVVLTAAQRAAARDCGMTLKEYAQSVSEIHKNGQDPNRPGLRFSAQTPHSSRR